MDAQQHHTCIENVAKMNCEQKKSYNVCLENYKFFEVQFCRGDNERREDKYSRREDKYEATTSNEFVAVVTFLRQYILIGSCNHVIFYVAHVLLLRAHCRKALSPIIDALGWLGML